MNQETAFTNSPHTTKASTKAEQSDYEISSFFFGFPVCFDNNRSGQLTSKMAIGESENLSIAGNDCSKFERLLIPPSAEKPTEYFNALQKWEGFVIKVSSETFLARLTPILGEGADIEAEIYIQEVAPDDRYLLESGAVFYWSIGYLDKTSGGRRRVSEIRFRRLRPWSKREIEEANIGVSKIRELFDES